MSTEASVPIAAALERATLAPKLVNITTGRDDSAFSVAERILVFANGPTGQGNPQRQGLNSALMGEGSPLNVLRGIPLLQQTIVRYGILTWVCGLKKPLIMATLTLTEEFAILGFVEEGWINGLGGGECSSVRMIVNRPVFRFL